MRRTMRRAACMPRTVPQIMRQSISTSPSVESPTVVAWCLPAWINMCRHGTDAGTESFTNTIKASTSTTCAARAADIDIDLPRHAVLAIPPRVLRFCIACAPRRLPRTLRYALSLTRRHAMMMRKDLNDPCTSSESWKMIPAHPGIQGWANSNMDDYCVL